MKMMKIDKWLVIEAIDTLRQANTTLLGITGLESPYQLSKKYRENERAINRRIKHAIELLEASVNGEI
jgi:hypothetical protein